MSADITKVINFYLICISPVDPGPGTLFRLINSECISFSLIKTIFFLSFWVISSASQRALSNYAIGFRFTLQIRPIMQGFPRGSTTCLMGQPVLPVQFLKKFQILT